MSWRSRRLERTAVARGYGGQRAEVPAFIAGKSHYYPFGMNHLGPWYETVAPENKYLYNGKELNGDYEINLMDYGARWYDPSIGRWNAVDPLAEKTPSWSAFNYVHGNPIRLIDPLGLSAEEKDERYDRRKAEYDAWQAQRDAEYGLFTPLLNTSKGDPVKKGEVIPNTGGLVAGIDEVVVSAKRTYKTGSFQQLVSTWLNQVKWASKNVISVFRYPENPSGKEVFGLGMGKGDIIDPIGSSDGIIDGTELTIPIGVSSSRSFWFSYFSGFASTIGAYNDEVGTREGLLGNGNTFLVPHVDTIYPSGNFWKNDTLFLTNSVIGTDTSKWVNVRRNGILFRLAPKKMTRAE